MESLTLNQNLGFAYLKEKLENNELKMAENGLKTSMERVRWLESLQL